MGKIYGNSKQLKVFRNRAQVEPVDWITEWSGSDMELDNTGNPGVR